MRKYLSYILCTLAAVVMTGCLELGVEIVEVPAVAKLQLKSTELVATRTAGNTDFNENLISQVQLFFSVDGKNVKYYTKVAELDQQDGQVKDLAVTLPASALTGLFPNNTANEKCKLFVVANAPDVPETSRKTITDVKKTVIGFTKDDDGKLTAKQASFVMTGEGDVTLGEDDNISGEVKLKRVAAKIEVTINLEKEITIGDKKWIPQHDKITMQFQGLTTSTVGGEDSDDAHTFTQDEFSINSNGEKHVATQKVPFYSYPTSWGKDSENVIILTIPWKRQDQNDYTTYKYQIPVNYDDKQLLSNYLYKLEVNVGVLGTPVEGAEDLVITPCSYVVIDWGTGTINAELSRPKYLVVDENKVVMNNVNTYEVSYASSDAVTAVITKITKPDMQDIPITNINIYPTEEGQTGASIVRPDTSIEGNKSPFEVKVIDGKIVLAHELVNDSDLDTFDYYQYTIEVQVTNKSGMTETIIFTQNPAMYIDPVQNTGYQVANSKGYVYVNNKSNATNGQSWYYVAGSLNETTSNSPYMYVINVTSFNSGNYVIGDPRQVENTDLGYADWVSAPALSGNSPRKLSFYYPTQTDRAYENYIAPRFRICSGYGRLGNGSTNSLQNAQYRCASYQEDGYPAGRWRLPTKAELEYVGRLCAEGMIPSLFTENNDYWAATAAFEYNSGSFREVEAGRYVRCVYDDWYWGSDRAVSVNAFTWGDVPRNE